MSDAAIGCRKRWLAVACFVALTSFVLLSPKNVSRISPISFACPSSAAGLVDPIEDLYILSQWQKSAAEWLQRFDNAKKTVPWYPPAASNIEVRYPYGVSVKVGSIDWWQHLGSWEPDTFDNFHRCITENTTYVGFGEWIGPTFLFGAALSAKAFALEPDPFAYFHLKHNILANPSIASKSFLSSHCVSDQHVTITMRGSGGSGSLAVNSNSTHLHELCMWEARCVPLDEFLRKQGVETNVQRLFIKIDTEGAESFILPQIRRFISSLSPKPHLHISIHPFRPKLDDAAMFDVVKMFKFIRQKKSVQSTRSLVSFGEICTDCEILLSDDESCSGV